MDLLQTVRKEGSRGGRADFKWEDVKNDAHRENYLGHSLMAPVGRWQRGRDLSWYAKGGDDDSQKTEAEKRAEELRKVKEAEEDAMAKALGLPPPDRSNANLVPLGEKSTLEGPDTPKVHAIEDGDRDRSGGTRGRERRPHKESGRRRSRSPDGSRKKEHRRRDRSASRHRHHRRRRSRSRSGDRRKHRHRSRSRGDGYTRRRTEDYSRRRSRSRDRSPRRRQSEGSYHRT